MTHAADRVVQVFAPAGADGLGSKGAGFLIGDGLVLTARHVIEDATGPCEVRVLGVRDWVATTVLWPGDEDGDGALLRVDASVGDVDRGRLGRLVGDDRAACAATGFPWAQLRSRDGASVRRTEHLVGKIDRFSGQEPGVAPWLLTIHVDGSVPDSRDDGGSPWEGMSGAGLVCGELLVGVVIVDPDRFGSDRLLAVPLTRLAAVPGFAETLRAAREQPVVLEAVEAQGVLERAYEPAPRPRARQTSSFLLGARYGVVPFRPRGELDELRAWALSIQDVDVAVLTGGGGMGKSRLARELCADLAEEEWVTGPLAHDPSTEPLSRLARVNANVLVVIDYAETRADDVIALLARLARSGASHRPRRLVLIARQLGDWWSQLPMGSTDDEVRELLRCALTRELGAVEDGVQDREDAYRQAIAAFATHTGPPLTDARAPDLSDRLFETLLFVHMAALGVLPGGADAPIGRADSIRADLLARTLEREQRYWTDSANALQPPLAVDEHVRQRAVAAATLAAPTTTGTPAGEDETAALLEVVPDLRDETALRLRVARWLHGLYPPSGGWIAPLEPDLLGEALVAQTLIAAPELSRDLLGRADAPTATRALTVLTRGSRHHDPCRAALGDALDHHLQRLTTVAVDVAQQLGDPIGVLIADVLERHPDSAVARDVLREIPQYTVSLREAAAVAATQALEGVPGDSPERAELLVHQSNRLSELGRREDALTAIEEAVTTYRRLAAARPDAFLPDLAASLNNQSGRLSELGRREDALTAIEEAVTTYRRLAAARPDAFLPDLAMSLNNQSGRLSELGRREDALTAIEEALQLVLPILERAHYFLPDAGSRLVHSYITRCQEAERQPDGETIRRMGTVLVAAGVIADDEP